MKYATDTLVFGLYTIFLHKIQLIGSLVYRVYTNLEFIASESGYRLLFDTRIASGYF